MAAVLSNLGVVAEYEGDLTGANDFHQRSLALRTEIGDRWAIAVSHTNIGMIAVLPSMAALDEASRAAATGRGAGWDLEAAAAALMQVCALAHAS